MLRDYLIYPKQYHFEKKKIIKNKCFFVMPFDNEFDIVYGTLRKSLSEAGYLCSRVDEIPKSTPIIGKILNEIANSQYIIVDITNGNANVFYELGIAHSFKDAQNIILIKRKDSNTAFDILHLTYFEYEIDNLKYLSSVLKNNLKDSEYLFDFYSAIEDRKIMASLNSDKVEFIEDIKSILGDDINAVTNILNYKIDFSEEILDNLLFRLEDRIKGYIQSASDEKTVCICNFLFEILVSLTNRNCIIKHVTYLLYDYFMQTDLSALQVLSLKTDLTIKFAQANVQLALVMPWIVQYFTKSKSATIDLNRYKLESFLLTTANKEINSIIINAVRHQDCHIREHFADIIGEKRLIEANDILKIQLLEESNYYSATSIIEALGKLKQESTESTIMQWFECNKSDILATKQYFVLKHIYLAYKNLNEKYAKDFYALYNKHLKYFIL